jgi:hypothetical protein
MVENLTTQRMIIYTCSCGKQILVVPDVQKMSKVIENHIAEHNKLKRKPLTEEKLTQEIIKKMVEV